MTAHDPRVTLTEAEAARIVACLPSGSVVRHDLLAVVGSVVAARLAPIRALLEDGPDTWEGYEPRDMGSAFLRDSVLDFTADLRAALDASSAPVSASQDHDGAEGQGRANGRCGVPIADAWTCELPKGHDEPDTHAYWPRWNVKAQ